MMRHLIINADGYGFTAGVTCAIEECIDFGTVRSLSANVNFEYASGLARLVRRHPDLSVGCHINPIVGSPVLPRERVPTLLDENGEFLYLRFKGRFLRGGVRRSELQAEMMAQVDRARDLAGRAFSHIDFHMGLHRLPGLYDIFLAVAQESGVRRIRTHRYRVGMESRFPRLRHIGHLLARPARGATFGWNLWLRRRAVKRGLCMPDRRVELTNMTTGRSVITVENYIAMLANLPPGFNEFVAHPGYVDSELIRWSRYRDQRMAERGVLLNEEFRRALYSSGVKLSGYRDIPVT